jgi:hypothetical protein
MPKAVAAFTTTASVTVLIYAARPGAAKLV